MYFLRQIHHLVLLLLGLHRQRPRDGVLMSAGFVISAAALAVMLAIPAGIERIAGQTGQADIAIVISDGPSASEENSTLSPEQIALLSTLAQVARDTDGRPLVAPQVLASAKLTQADGSTSTVLLRGVSPMQWQVLAPDALGGALRPQEGQRQLLVSRTLAQRFPELDRHEVNIRQRSWEIVAPLDADGSLWESEIWTDLSALQAAYNRPGRVSSLWVKLTSADALPGLIEAARQDPRLQKIRVINQREYYQQQTRIISQFAWYAALGISMLLGSGAILAISSTLGMALDNRRREMATLRALGFDAAAVGLASLLDVVLIGIVATALALLVTYLVLDGSAFGTSSGQMAVYAQFSISPQVMGQVLLYGLVLGFLSAAGPLWKTVKSQLVDALKEA